MELPAADHGIEMEGMLGQQDPSAARAADDAGLKKRMRIVTEAIVKMVCPVFLAVCVSLAKLDMGDRHRVRDSLSPLAGCTLVSGIVSLLPLSLSNWFPEKLYGFSMLFIHLCGVLLMVLAFLTLVLISEVYIPWVVLLVPTAIFTLNWGRVTVSNGHGRAVEVYGECLDDLESSVDFSASITNVLFLGLGGLVLGGQYSTIQKKGPEDLLFCIIGLSFIICIAGVLFMLVGMVPPVISGGSRGICHIIDGFNYFFGGAVTLIVLLITLGTLRNLWVVTLAIVLSVIPYPIWPVLSIDTGGQAGVTEGGEDVKPASLDLTKVTFTGFLAISVYTITENSPVSIHEYSSWFIFFTAIAVNNGLGWRLLTHQKKPSAARFTAANVASFGAHLYIVVAAIPFACMAFEALRKITAPSPTPCR